MKPARRTRHEAAAATRAVTARGVAIALGCALFGCTSSSFSLPPPPADRVFVSQAGSSTVALVNAKSGAIETRIEVGMLPHNLVLSPDRRTLYAVLVGSQAIAEIDVA